MFRCRLSILVLLGFFANQLAMIPHAHAADLPGHDSRPHVHLAGLSSASHTHNHQHGHEHSDSHRHDSRSHTPTDQPQVGIEPLTDHDVDALYVPVGSVNSASFLSQKAVDQQVPVQLWLVATDELVLTSLAQPFWLPHDESRDGCQLFLRLRNLRI